VPQPLLKIVLQMRVSGNLIDSRSARLHIIADGRSRQVASLGGLRMTEENVAA